MKKKAGIFSLSLIISLTFGSVSLADYNWDIMTSTNDYSPDIVDLPGRPSSGELQEDNVGQLDQYPGDTGDSHEADQSPYGGLPRSYFSASSYSSGGAWSLGNISGFGLPDQGIGAIIANIVYWLLGIFSALGILGFVISGVMYLLSSGDEDMADRAKDGMKYSVYGIIIGLSGFIVIRAVDYALRGAFF